MPARFRALVTGGSGFLGQSLVKKLVESGEYEVTVFDLRPFPDPSVPCKSVTGDLTSVDSITEAMRGHDVCFHTATFSPTGKNATSFGPMYKVNVVGTENVILACQAVKCTRLVYTSSASVAWDGSDYKFVDESVPYPTRFHDFYSKTKMLAEKLVLEANGQKGVQTVALRPSGIFGENDPLLVPTAVDQCREGKMRFVIGDGKNLMDWTYVGNVADSHLLADRALRDGRDGVAGQPFFITNGDPRPFWTFLGTFLGSLGYPPKSLPHIHLPFWLIVAIAYIAEVAIALLRALGVNASTEFTVFRMLCAAKHRTFSCQRARERLGYDPAVSVEEGLKRMVASFQHLRKEAIDALGKGATATAAAAVGAERAGRGRSAAGRTPRSRGPSPRAKSRGRRSEAGGDADGDADGTTTRRSTRKAA